MNFFTLLISFSVLLNEETFAHPDDSVWLLGEYFKTFSFNCHGMVAALTPNKKGMSFYLVSEDVFAGTYNFSQPGKLIGIPDVGYRVVVAHNTSYMTILDSGDMTTNYIPVEDPSSLVLVEDLACLLPNHLLNEMAIITCMNLTTLEYKNCPYDSHLHIGSHGYTDPIKNWVYIFDGEGIQPSSIHKYSVKDGCLKYIHDSPHEKQDKLGEHAWFSYDGSRIFLDNGLTLKESDDVTQDMKINGNFNNKSEDQYIWFSQPADTEHHMIAALKKDIPETLFLYESPSLKLQKSIKIPMPPKAKSIEPQSVYYCSGYNGLVLVFAQFTLDSGKRETGVAYINLAE